MLILQCCFQNSEDCKTIFCFSNIRRKTCNAYCYIILIVIFMFRFWIRSCHKWSSSTNFKPRIVQQLAGAKRLEHYSWNDLCRLCRGRKRCLSGIFIRIFILNQNTINCINHILKGTGVRELQYSSVLIF